jgi:hypothetical protein
MWDQSLLGLRSSHLVYNTVSTLRLNYWICPHLLKKEKRKHLSRWALQEKLFKISGPVFWALFLRNYIGWGVKLTSHLYLMSNLKIPGSPLSFRHTPAWGSAELSTWNILFYFSLY